MKESITKQERHMPLLSEFTGSQPLSVEMYEDLEPEASITEIISYRRSSFRRFFYWLLVVLTCGIFYLLERWLLSLRLRFGYSRSPLDKSSHLLVSTAYMTELVPLRFHTHSKIPMFYFEFQHLPYHWNGEKFEPLEFEPESSATWLISKWGSGHTEEQSYRDKQLIFGRCQIFVPVMGCFAMFMHLFFNPFYIFQLFSVGLWMWDDYYYYASAIFVTTVLSLSVTLVQTRKNLWKIHRMAKYSCQVRVFRNGWSEVRSEELTPGDLIEIPSEVIMPCDVVLISGGCAMEEGMLTGESVPVLKDPLTYDPNKIYNVNSDKRHTLYEGTYVIQTRNYSQTEVTGIVVRTGFQTMKGKLIRSILFPKPNKFKFYRDAMIFISVLALIAIIGFLCVLPLQIYQGVPTKDLIDRSLDLFTVSVPPALPAAMAIGTTFAIIRLRSKEINCISPPRVNVSGKIDTFVFDKTGTLTEDGMNFMGVLPVFKGKFENFCEDMKNSAYSKLLECMATCHSLTLINDKLMGDPQDLQIFNSTGWSYELPDMFDPVILAVVKEKENIVAQENRVFDKGGSVVSMLEFGHELGIIHIFHFSSNLKRMGVIAKNLYHGTSLFYMKGAPEVVLQRCNQDSMPANMLYKLDELTRKGYRVLACAYKEIDTDYINLKDTKIEDFDSDLKFLGLIVLQNQLKPETIPEIHKLRNAEIRAIMATGDALLTAICVGREAGFVSKSVVFGEMNTEGQLAWSTEAQEVVEDPCQLGNQVDVAMTGEAFSNLSHSDDKELLLYVIDHCQVYGRMAPDHKALLVEHLQSLGYLVGMCGDGANDCGALKTADIGISLSETETSVAAPFTSKAANISCVDSVLREGRCALVTSIQIFKYIALYSTIQFFSVCTLYSFGSSLSDYQFLAIDLFTILPLAITMSYTQPYHRLSKNSPSASLVSAPVLSSVIGQTFLAGIAQLGSYLLLTTMPFFDPVQYDSGKEAKEFYFCQENTVIFLVSWYQYLSICVIYSIGKPWKKPAHTNPFLTVNVTVLAIASLWAIVWPFEWIRDTVQIEKFPFYFRVLILGVCLFYSAVSLCWEKYLIPYINQTTVRRNKKKKYEKLKIQFISNKNFN